MPRSLNDPTAEAPLITQRILEKVQLNVAHKLSRVDLAGLAQDVRIQVVEDTLTESFIYQLRTLLLGANFRTVYLEEELVIPAHATWWDHLKEATVHRLPIRCRRLRRWLSGRIKYVEYRKTATKSEKVATHLCPHVAVPTKDGKELIHIAWLDGDVEEAQAMREQLACNGRLN